MDQLTISLTAVYLKCDHGYVGFVEELPGFNSHGRTILEARESLRRLTLLSFDLERAQSEEFLKGKAVAREQFLLPIPPACR
jgi:predicted RNase H-like HicB family nuclease